MENKDYTLNLKLNGDIEMHFITISFDGEKNETCFYLDGDHMDSHQKLMKKIGIFSQVSLSPKVKKPDTIFKNVARKHTNKQVLETT